MEAKEYQKRVEQVSPKSNLWTGCLKAFLVGGLICVIGQAIGAGVQALGVTDEKMVGSWTSICLIFLGALLTGVGWYDNIGHFAGAGSIIPITGFANGIVASAIEYKKEGFILGLGAKMFSIAGSVLVYGTLVSSAAGLIVWIVSLF